ncbi:MAG: hypothetical protein ACI9J3_004139, partial [Parvicellaceae bacterium]
EYLLEGSMAILLIIYYQKSLNSSPSNPLRMTDYKQKYCQKPTV